jgi:hypothetical protein
MSFMSLHDPLYWLKGNNPLTSSTITMGGHVSKPASEGDVIHLTSPALRFRHIETQKTYPAKAVPESAKRDLVRILASDYTLRRLASVIFLVNDLDHTIDPTDIHLDRETYRIEFAGLIRKERFFRHRREATERNLSRLMSEILCTHIKNHIARYELDGQYTIDLATTKCAAEYLKHPTPPRSHHQ